MDAAKAQAMVDAALVKHGAKATLHTSADTFDFVTGAVTEGNTDKSVRVIPKVEERKDADGIVVRTRTALCRLATTPAVGDFLTISGVEYRIRCVEVSEYKGEIVSQTLDLGPY